MTPTNSKKDNDRIYQNLMHLHKEEHIGDDCFCTTEVAGAYSNILDEVNKQLTQALKELEKELNGGRTFTNASVISETINNKIKELEGL